MYLCQDLNRCPSTIDGYRTAIVDTLGPAGHHISQSSDLNRLLSSFHRVWDRPKSSRNLPKWNLSVVLPSVKQVSDFFLYQDLNRCPSTIDSYRTAIIDTLGPAGHHISQSSDLNRLLSSFHRDRPKSSRNLPKWNLPVLLNELTKALFEPMKNTDLKHLTLKTAFLLALASGKCRSEIPAWVAKYLI